MSILVLSSGYLGDNICSEPAVMGLCLQNPSKKVTVVTGFPQIWKDYPVNNLCLKGSIFELYGLKFESAYMLCDCGGPHHITTGLLPDKNSQLNLWLPYSVPHLYGNFPPSPKVKFESYVVLSNDASVSSRLLTPEDFGSLVEFVKECIGVPVVITGRTKERKGCSDPMVLDLRGETSLGELFGVAKHSMFGVVADSGLSHILAGYRVPYVVWSSMEEKYRTHGPDLTFWVSCVDRGGLLDRLKDRVVDLVGYLESNKGL